jgi:hypothetical protein
LALLKRPLNSVDEIIGGLRVFRERTFVAVSDAVKMGCIYRDNVFWSAISIIDLPVLYRGQAADIRWGRVRSDQQRPTLLPEYFQEIRRNRPWLLFVLKQVDNEFWEVSCDDQLNEAFVQLFSYRRRRATIRPPVRYKSTVSHQSPNQSPLCGAWFQRREWGRRRRTLKASTR